MSISGSGSVNEVTLIGWIVNDPIIKEGKTGQNLLVFNLATKRIWVNKNEESNEELTYHKIAVWGKLAEKAEKLLSNGNQVYVKGYLHNRKIQITGEEKPRTITEVVLDDFLLLDKRKSKIAEESDSDHLLDEK